jgi:hypothetical protein
VLQGDDPDPTNNYSQSSFTVTAVTPLFLRHLMQMEKIVVLE